MCKNKSFIFGMGLLAGVVGGILAGVLYAPKPGEETRKELKDAAVQIYERNSPTINDAKQQAMDSIDLMRYKIERQLRKFSNMLKNNKLQKAKELEASGEDFI